MNLKDAIAYQDSLDAVDKGAFNSTQAVEVDAVIKGVVEYLDGLAARIAGYKTAVAAFAVFNDATASALRTSIDGSDPLPSPRVQIFEGGVMTADEVATVLSDRAAAAEAAANAAADLAAQQVADAEAAQQAEPPIMSLSR